MLCLLVCSRLVYLHTPRALGGHLLFGLFSTLCVIGTFIVCVLSFLSGCSCHRGFADA